MRKEEEDPRAELVQKLLEYKMYKYMSYGGTGLEMRQGLLPKTQNLPEEVLQYAHRLIPRNFSGLTLERIVRSARL